MADEFFRGSYSTAIMLEGKIAPGVQYKVALGNQLSTLGVSASQMDPQLNTLASGLWWMPTTGEFGPTMGFGDYEEHQKLATLLGVHYSRSRENQAISAQYRRFREHPNLPIGWHAGFQP